MCKGGVGLTWDDGAVGGQTRRSSLHTMNLCLHDSFIADVEYSASRGSKSR